MSQDYVASLKLYHPRKIIQLTNVYTFQKEKPSDYIQKAFSK